MLYPPVADLLKNVDSRYLLVNVVAQRARQIAEEAEVFQEELTDKPVTLAIREVAEGKLSACVKDDYKMQRVKAFIVLKPEFSPTDEIKESIKEHCKKNIAKYALPYDIEFRAELPKTLVGKVAYRVLEEEELARYEKGNQN